MKNVIFYIEYASKSDKRKDIQSGNCVAILTDCPANLGMKSAVSAVYIQNNSPCNFGEVSIEYLRENCKKTSEAKAREIHPELIKYLEFDPLSYLKDKTKTYYLPIYFNAALIYKGKRGAFHVYKCIDKAYKGQLVRLGENSLVEYINTKRNENL